MCYRKGILPTSSESSERLGHTHTHTLTDLCKTLQSINIIQYHVHTKPGLLPCTGSAFQALPYALKLHSLN